MRDEVSRKLDEKNIKLETKGRVANITSSHVNLEDGRSFSCDVPIWATGAEP